MNNQEATRMRITYISSEKTVCPVCDATLYREELHSGRGRIVADTLTRELRYIYKPSEKYGIVNPLLYSITVCPQCTYSAFKTDFTRISKQTIAGIRRTENARVFSLSKIFANINFRQPRGLPAGILSYYYALLCYQHWPTDLGPTIKQALATLRLAWLCGDLYALEPDNNWDAMTRIFYRKARYLYRLAWEHDESQTELLPKDFNLGPDTDTNYGIDGIRYLCSYLDFRWGPKYDPTVRKGNLKQAKERLALVFSAKKERRVVPPPILANARDIHTAINDELRNL